MNYKILTILTIAILFITSNIYSEDINMEHYYNNLDDAKDKFLDNLDNLPNSIKNSIDKEKIRFEVTGDNGINYVVVWEKAKEGYRFTKDNIEDYSMKIKVAEEKLNDIANSENIVKEISEAIKDKSMELEGRGFWSKLKLTISKLALKVAGWFT